MQNQIPNNWQKVKLGELIYINSKQIGANYPHDEIEYVDISSVGTGILDRTTHYKLSKAPGRAKRLLSDGDTIISTVRPNRRSFLFIKQPKENLVVSTGFAVLSPKLNITDPKFLHYLVTIKTFTEYLSSNVKGSAYPAISPDVIENAEVNVPNYPEQKRISSILSSFDDKIELNNKINKTLEETASAIFKEWFGKKTNNEELIVKNLIKDITFVKTGNRPGKLDKKKENKYAIQVYGAKEIMGYTNKSLYDQPIIITGRVGTIGEVTIINESSWPSDNALILIPKDYNYLYFIYFLAKRINYLSLNRGSSKPLIAQSDIENYPIDLPDEKKIKEFNIIVSKLFLLKNNKEKENQKLAAFRDLLLPKLMKGEIRVQRRTNNEQ